MHRTIANDSTTTVDYREFPIGRPPRELAHGITFGEETQKIDHGLIKCNS